MEFGKRWKTGRFFLVTERWLHRRKERGKVTERRTQVMKRALFLWGKANHL